MRPPLDSGLPSPEIGLTRAWAELATLEKGGKGLEASQSDKTQGSDFTTALNSL